jgi:hypothetical protein
MSIKLTAPVLIGGAVQPTGTSLTLAPDQEAEYVNRGSAVYTSGPSFPGNQLPVSFDSSGSLAFSATQQAKGAGLLALSVAKALVDYYDNAATVDLFAAMTGWTMQGTPGIQASGGKAYSVGTQGAGSGANRSFALAANENMRAVFIVNHDVGGASGGCVVGVSSDAAGAIPASAGGAGFGLYFRTNTQPFQQLSSGTFTTISGAPTPRTTQYIVTVTVDQQWISVVARSLDGADEIRTRRARAGFTIGNLFMFNSDARALTGINVEAVGARKQFGSVAPRTEIEGIGYTVHWSGDATQDFKLTLPANYDSRIPVPVCIMFHGNGSDEQHFADNANGKAAGNALLTAGYATITCTVTANKSTWGAQASLDAYAAAYKFVRERYALGPVVIYGNSMGGLESLLAIAKGAIPGVVAWGATHPACSLEANYNSASGFTSLIKTAYGISSDGSDYETKTAGYDPMRMEALEWGRMPMWVLYATDDTAVIPGDNAVQFIAKIGVYAKPLQVQTTTGGHSASVSSFMASLVAFYDMAVGR